MLCIIYYCDSTGTNNQIQNHTQNYTQQTNPNKNNKLALVKKKKH